MIVAGPIAAMPPPKEFASVAEDPVVSHRDVVDSEQEVLNPHPAAELVPRLG